MDAWQVSEFWMPALIGGVALPLLLLLGWLLNRLPAPTEADKAQRTERVTLDRQGRLRILKDFFPVLLLLFVANLFITILRDVKEDFIVNIIDVEAAGLSSWAFAKIDGLVTLIIPRSHGSSCKDFSSTWSTSVSRRSSSSGSLPASVSRAMWASSS